MLTFREALQQHQHFLINPLAVWRQFRKVKSIQLLRSIKTSTLSRSRSLDKEFQIWKHQQKFIYNVFTYIFRCSYIQYTKAFKSNSNVRTIYKPTSSVHTYICTCMLLMYSRNWLQTTSRRAGPSIQASSAIAQSSRILEQHFGYFLY